MKERPILFQGAMVRAILDGNKTQTRRLVKPQPLMYEPGQDVGLSDYINDSLVCPYGKPGERLWVRESGVRSLLAGRGDQMGMFRHDVPATTETGRWWIESTRAAGASYNAVACTRQAALLGASAKVCPSIHMPRWACRILLEVVSVRVEQLNECSEGDAYEEGAQAWAAEVVKDGNKFPSIRAAYRALWESINGAGSWSVNPWVWVVEFRRVQS